MAKRIAKFEKVSFEQFKKDWIDTFSECDMDLSDENIGIIYDLIETPKRATMYSAGYDFKSPLSFGLLPGETIKIPTGIRCWMNPDWVLKLYPRSGLGFKYRLRLENTVGIIDADYYNSKNEGHIFIKITNCGEKSLEVNTGEGFAQGIFVEYGITFGDNVEDIRDGGLGSTDERKE